MLGLMQSQPLLISSLIEFAERHHGDGEIVSRRVEGDIHRYTYKDLAARSRQLANALDREGLQFSDRVASLAWNGYRHMEMYFGVSGSGRVLHTINPRLHPEQIAWIVNHAEDQILCFDLTFLPLVQAVHAKCPAVKKWVALCDADKLPADSGVPGLTSYETWIGAQTADYTWPVFDENTASSMCYTSGTTGNPKGATLTHHNVVNNARFIAQAMDFTEADSLCIPVPLYHCFGMVLAVLACVSTGATMVFPGESFEPVATLQAVSEERCTALHGVPTMFIAELDHPRFAEFDLSRLRTGIMAGSPCPIETMKRVIAEMHLSQITIAYGMTETSPVSFQSSTTDPLERRVSTVGRIQPMLEAKVVDADGKVVPVGEKGELLVRGYSVMQGYWGDAERTREAVRDGWMHTGDLATIDAEGYCNIVGRAKDMLIRGGENVYPREIEEFLFRHPKVQSVQVFGVPDTRYGEEICAWIVPKPGQSCTEDEIRDFCRDQIAHYKVPRYIRFVEDMPMTITGKVQKFVMREKMMAELGLQEAKTA